jgi:LemA protein
VTAIVITVAIILVLYLVYAYNSLISKRNNVENAAGAIDAELKKRRDLIPNLVESVKTYMQYEKELLEKLVRLREEAEKATDAEIKFKLEQEISKTLNAVKIRAENYPELKASQNFLQLQVALTDVEESIAAARRFYNQAVTEYNNAIEQIPYNLFAKMLGFQRKQVFTIPEEERSSINIGELFKK